MIPLYTEEEYNNTRPTQSLLCKCLICEKPFNRTKAQIAVALTGKKDRVTCKYCSQICSSVAKKTKVLVKCKQCDSEFYKKPMEIQRTKNNFCKQSCAAIYNNINKKVGIRRSRLEAWLEERLITNYPHIEFHFNRKDAINSELDIYIPSMKLAFELNGLFHYEPVFGKDKLDQIQNNDNRKFAACAENNISLCVIDTSSQKHFKEKSANKFLEVIESIIKNQESL